MSRRYAASRKLEDDFSHLEEQSIERSTVERAAHGCAAGPEAVYSP